jgi:hypothetical protein
VDLVMPRTTKSVNETASVVDTTVAEVSVTEENDNVKEVVTNTKNTVVKVSLEPLNDSDEIDVVSIIPNVSYKDSKTGDMYEWDEVGHVEIMTFETLKNMWRNHKGYFRNMWLKPNDERVINKFGLTKTFEKYAFLMDESNYTRDKIDDLCYAISNTPNELKYSIVLKIKDLIVSEEVKDIAVIRALEKHLKIDLISFLD